MRDPRWPQLLGDKVEEWRGRAFRWGRADCWQFVGDAVEAMTGIDYRDRFPKYRSKREALAILESTGDMLGLAESVWGPAKPPAHALEGDVVLLNLRRGLTAGICLGQQCAATGTNGLVFVSRDAAAAAWSI
jgi:cell wall-associated NlpC family hydrolase